MNPTHLLRQAAEWRLISLLFDCPVGDWRAQIAALAGEVADADLRDAVQSAQTEAAEGLYHSLFGPGGPAPPREISYRNWVQPGYLLAELKSYYDAFAYLPATPEVPDHVAVETGFIGYLSLKEAFALSNGEPEKASLAAAAAQRFRAEHLAWLAGPLAQELAASGVTYLSRAAAALQQRVGPAPETPSLTLPILSAPAEAGCPDAAY